MNNSSSSQGSNSIDHRLKGTTQLEHDYKTANVILIGFGIFCITVSLVAALNQVWRYFASRKVGPLTTTPTIPFSLMNLSRQENAHGMRFLCGYRYNKQRDLSSNFKLQMKRLLRIGESAYIPNDARVISFKSSQFDFGAECHEFEPKDGVAPGSHFTYQMFGDNRIQVTNYVKDGVSYVAGVCIYIPESFFAPSIISYRKTVIDQLWKPICNVRPTTVVKMDRPCPRTLEESESNRLLNEDPLPGSSAVWTVEPCPELRRDLMTTLNNGSVYHKEWDPVEQKMKIHKCGSCTRDVDHDLPPSYASLPMS